MCEAGHKVGGRRTSFGDMAAAHEDPPEPQEEGGRAQAPDDNPVGHVVRSVRMSALRRDMAVKSPGPLGDIEGLVVSSKTTNFDAHFH